MIVIKILLYILGALLALGGLIFWYGFIWACFHKGKLGTTREIYGINTDKDKEKVD